MYCRPKPYVLNKRKSKSFTSEDDRFSVEIMTSSSKASHATIMIRETKNEELHQHFRTRYVERFWGRGLEYLETSELNLMLTFALHDKPDAFHELVVRVKEEREDETDVPVEVEDVTVEDEVGKPALDQARLSLFLCLFLSPSLSLSPSRDDRVRLTRRYSSLAWWVMEGIASNKAIQKEKMQTQKSWMVRWGIIRAGRLPRSLKFCKSARVVFWGSELVGLYLPYIFCMAGENFHVRFQCVLVFLVAYLAPSGRCYST